MRLHIWYFIGVINEKTGMSDASLHELHRLCRDVLHFDKLGFWICLGVVPATVRYKTEDFLEIEDIHDHETLVQKVSEWPLYNRLMNKT